MSGLLSSFTVRQTASGTVRSCPVDHDALARTKPPSWPAYLGRVVVFPIVRRQLLPWFVIRSSSRIKNESRRAGRPQADARSPLVRVSVLQFALAGRARFPMFDRQRAVVGRHSSVVLAGNGIARLVSTFFKHASTLDKVFGVGHRTPPSETVPHLVFEVLFRTPEHGLLMNRRNCATA
jgi:hypothetical protein